MAKLKRDEKKIINRAIEMFRYLLEGGYSGNNIDMGSLVVAATIQEIWREKNKRNV
jgi:translation elongation factor EF-Tu-like GTPase